MPRKSARRRRAWGSTGCCAARAAVVSGILNGIDDDGLEPGDRPAAAGAVRRGAHLAERAAQQGGRAGAHLAGAPTPTAPLFAVVSRLTWQKGMDLLLAAIPALLAVGAQLAVLGAGDTADRGRLPRRRRSLSGRVGCVIGYDEALAHLIQAGADALLVPSRFEPCGLTQLCALRYGAVPVVARVGGLADTVIDASPMALAAGVATGRAVRARSRRNAGGGDPPHRRAAPRTARPGGACSTTAWRPTCPGATRPAATPPCFANSPA